MERSLFVQFVAFFTSIAKEVVERVNGKKTAQNYYHKEMLTPELSTDLKWETLNVDGSTVAADVVAMDTSLPLKKRDAISTASGDIPKLGTKRQLNEKTMSDIDVLQARNADTTVIVQKIFSDVPKVILGVYERLELMFLQMLSTGVTVIDDDTNVGIGVRIDLGYKAGNKFGATVAWSNPAAKPIDDVKRVLRAARNKGNTPRYILMDDATFDVFAANAQVREEYAFSQNFVGSQIPTPDLEQVNAMMLRRHKLTIVVIDRTVTTERDGVRTVHKPWADNKIVFLEDLRVGKLFYGILAEETRQNKAVTYEKVDGYILLKRWHSPEPFAEFTSSQALAVPVINNVDSIYVLDAEEAEDDVQIEGDADFKYKDVDYTKASVVAALKLAKPTSKLTTASTDAKILEAINGLSDEQILIFEANIVESEE